ncbi:VC0807 family protein [Streptomyces stramineus]
MVIDLGVPLALYYGLRCGFGVSSLWALAAGAAVGAVRGGIGLVRHRRLEPLPLLVLISSVVGMVLSLVSGSEQFMIAKDSFGSGVIGLVTFWSAFTTRPMMTEGLRPFFTKGDPGRLAAWDRIADRPAFRRVERRTTLVWGTALTAECAARVILAFVLPVSTMVWLSTVLLVGAIILAVVVGAVVAGPLQTMLDEETATAA